MWRNITLGAVTLGAIALLSFLGAQSAHAQSAHSSTELRMDLEDMLDWETSSFLSMNSSLRRMRRDPIARVETRLGFGSMQQAVDSPLRPAGLTVPSIGIADFELRFVGLAAEEGGMVLSFDLTDSLGQFDPAERVRADAYNQQYFTAFNYRMGFVSELETPWPDTAIEWEYGGLIQYAASGIATDEHNFVGSVHVPLADKYEEESLGLGLFGVIEYRQLLSEPSWVFFMRGRGALGLGVTWQEFTDEHTVPYAPTTVVSGEVEEELSGIALQASLGAGLEYQPFAEHSGVMLSLGGRVDYWSRGYVQRSAVSASLQTMAIIQF